MAVAWQHQAITRTSFDLTLFVQFHRDRKRYDGNDYHWNIFLNIYAAAREQ